MKNSQSWSEGPSKVDMKNFKARRSTLFKKASQLSTLCGVDVPLVMYRTRSLSLSSILSTALPAPKPTPSPYIHTLAVDDLSNFHGFLSDKLDKVNAMINMMTATNSDTNQFQETVLRDDDFADVDLVSDDFGQLVDESGLINDAIADGSFSLDDFINFE